MSKFTDRLWRELVGEHGTKLAQMRRPATKPAKKLPGWGRPLARPRMAGAFALVGVVALNASGAFGLNVLGLHSALTATSLPAGFQSAAGTVYQITPTQTTCSQFAGLPGSTPPGSLSTVQYSAKGSTISQTNPGVFFYWARLSVFGPGQQTFTVTQTTKPLPAPQPNPYSFFFPTATGGSGVFDSSCNAVAGETIGPTTPGTKPPINSATNTVTFNAPASCSKATPCTFFLGIKYSPSGVVGDATPASVNPGPPASTTIEYDFTTTQNGSVSSVASLQLQKK